MRFNKSSSATEHPLKLLCHTDSLIVLLLRYFPGIQQLLYLLLCIAGKVLPELHELL